MEAELISYLLIPAKLLLMAVMATLTRIFFQKEKLTFNLFFSRLIMGFFVAWVVYVMAYEIAGFSNSLSIAISGWCVFASREILELMLLLADNPQKIKDILKKNTKFLF